MTIDISVYDSKETESARIARFHEFIQQYSRAGYNLEQTTKDQYVLSTKYAQATVNFWDDIIELNVINLAKDEEVFALHFQLRDDVWEHGEQLYGEMVNALLAQSTRKTIDILLTCSSAMTTTIFAQKLNHVAKTLSLDYTFHAVAVRDIFREGLNYDVVLLAPQVSFMYENIRSALRGTVVVEIPPALFGAYDAAGCIDLIREQLAQARQSREEYAIHKILRGEDTNACVLSIVLKQTSEIIEIGWRVYDHGETVLEDVVIKKTPIHSPGDASQGITSRSIGLVDFTDIVDTVIASEDYGSRIEAIALAVIGAVEDGVINLPYTGLHNVDMQGEIERRYKLPTIVSNNVNAAALGWYSQQDDYQNIVFHSQSFGLATGGQGLIIDGKLHEGFHGFAGELQRFYPTLDFGDSRDNLIYTNRLYEPEIIVQLLAKLFAVDIGLLAPEVICLRCRSTPDMEVIRKELEQYIPREEQPELIFIPHFTDYIFTGLYVMAIQRLRLAE